MGPTYDDTNKKQVSFHSSQGKIWRLGSKFLLVRFRIGMSCENNSSSICVAQLVWQTMQYILPGSTSFRNLV